MPGYGTGLARAPDSLRWRLRLEAVDERPPLDPLLGAPDPAAGLAGERGWPRAAAPRTATAAKPSMPKSEDICTAVAGIQQLAIGITANDVKYALRAPGGAAGRGAALRATKTLVSTPASLSGSGTKRKTRASALNALIIESDDAER